MRFRFRFVLVVCAVVVTLVACGSGAAPEGPAAEPTAAGAATAETASSGAEGEGEEEPNDAAGQATEISEGVWAGVVGEDDDDWYAVEVPDGHVVRVGFTPGEGSHDLAVTLLSPEQDELWRAEGMAPGEERSGSQVMSGSSGGSYYLKVVGGEGPYAIDLALEAQNDGGVSGDAGVGGDAGDEAAEAVPVEAEGSFSGRVGDFDEGDWYAFQVGDGQVLDVAFTPAGGADGMVVELLSPEEEPVWRQEGLAGGETGSVTQVMGSSSGGTYYLAVRHGRGEYAVDVSAENQDDAGCGGDAGGEAAEAVPLEAEGSYAGRVGDLDERDWYALDATADGSLTFVPGDEAHGMAVVVQDAEGEELWREEGVEAGEVKRYDFAAAAGQPLYVMVAFGDGGYTLEVE